MTGAWRQRGPLIVFLLAMAGLSVFLGHLEAEEYWSTANLDLWGRSLLASGGQSQYGDVVTAFPPMALIAMICLNWLLPSLGALAPLVLAALLAAALLAAWFASLRAAGLGLPASVAAIGLLALNPLFLRSVAEGASFMFLEWGLWMLAMGMFNLREQLRVNDIILVAAALVVLGFAGPFGMVLACASLPFLALVVPPDLLAKSAAGVFMVLFFPLAFSAAGFLLVNWVFTGDPLHFAGALRGGVQGINLPAQSGAATPGMVALAVAGVMLACPLGLWGLVRFRRFGPLHYETLATFGLLLAAILLGWAAGDLPPPALTASLGCTIAAACAAACVRYSSLRFVILPALLTGLIGGSIVVLVDSTAPTRRWRAAVLSQPVPATDPELARLGRALRGKRNILFDAAAAPAAVAERGSAMGIASAQSEDFHLATLTYHLTSSVLVVRSTESEWGADSLGRAFPDLFRTGAPGYHIVFDSPTWRIFQSDAEGRQ